MNPRRSLKERFLILGLGLAAAVLLSSATVQAQTEVHRWNWIPSGRTFLALGDMWLFSCPAKGTVTVWANTWDDNGNASSNLDLVIEVRDKKGNLLLDQFGDPTGGLGDDEFDCAVTPTCGWKCPFVFEIPCGKGNPHSIAVYSSPGFCVGGGSYEMVVSAKDKKGRDVPAKKIKLGGSSNRKVPGWGGEMIDKMGPVLNDEFIPAFYSANPATVSVTAPFGEVHTEETFRLPEKMQK